LHTNIAPQIFNHMTLLYCPQIFLHHETGFHPERAERIRLIPDRLKESGLMGRCQQPEFMPITRRRLAAVHSPLYIDEVWALDKSGGGHLDPDTVVGPGSYDVALKAAGCVCDAVERVLRGEDSQGLCLVRPPGHHALMHHAMGFCLFNNVAVAAKAAVGEFQLDRVLIVDWDIHHGNGTQDTFWEDPAVGYYSIHRWPFFPGTGAEDEIGGGGGRGYTLNSPVAFGTSREEYFDIFRAGLENMAAKIKPQLVLLSAGFDTHRLDPVGNLGLETEDFAALTDIVADAADAYADGRLVSVLEGGYNPEIMADSVETHLAAMLKRSGA